MTDEQIASLVARASESGSLSAAMKAEVASAIDWLRSTREPKWAYRRGMMSYNYHSDIGYEDTAVPDLQEALVYDPSDLDARFLLACAYFDRGEFRQARTHLSRVVADGRLRAPLQRWRWLKAQELLAVARVETGEKELSEVLGAWYEEFKQTEEEDRASPTEMRSLLLRQNLPRTAEYALIWD